MFDHVKALKAEASTESVHETQAVKAELEVKTAWELVQVMFDQADAITFERNMLQDDVKDLPKRVIRPTEQFKASRRFLRKEKKRLEQFKECFFMFI